MPLPGERESVLTPEKGHGGLQVKTGYRSNRSVGNVWEEAKFPLRIPGKADQDEITLLWCMKAVHQSAAGLLCFTLHPGYNSLYFSNHILYSRRFKLNFDINT